jgi:hypothetical protein
MVILYKILFLYFEFLVFAGNFVYKFLFFIFLVFEGNFETNISFSDF